MTYIRRVHSNSQSKVTGASRSCASSTAVHCAVIDPDGGNNVNTVVLLAAS